MSLQVQSSQQPTSGRRTPQIYQNFGSPSSTSTTNGSNAGGTKSSTKLSLKASSGKQSPSVDTTVTEPAAKDSPKSSNPTANKVTTNTSTSSLKPEKAEKEKDEKASATNGSTNGNQAENVTNGKHEEVATPVKPAPTTPKKEDEKEKKAKESPKTSPRTTPQKQPTEPIPVEQPKTPDNNSKKSKELPLVTPEQKKKEKPAVENSLIAEKTLKGFTAEGDEMESLVVEPSEYEDSPMPPRTGGKTKLLKYGSGPPTRARISPFRVNEATANASTVVNLSTVSEGQNSAPESNEASPAVDFNRPLRTISGRRTTRPISDIHFTYRKSVDLNDSLSSLNVTVGSEIHNDSVRTPAPGSSRKRKAMTPESTSDALDVKEVCESPKRGRLDFSGLLGIVASPVTLLKNRLSRVRLHASTPVAKRSFDEENLNTCVTAEATTTTANISGEAAKMETGEEKKVENVEKADGEQKAEASLTEVQIDLPECAEKAKDDGSGDVGEPVEVKDVTNKQRQFCVVM